LIATTFSCDWTAGLISNPLAVILTGPDCDWLDTHTPTLTVFGRDLA
jgi:hypothetical protein